MNIKAIEIGETKRITERPPVKIEAPSFAPPERVEVPEWLDPNKVKTKEPVTVGK